MLREQRHEPFLHHGTDLADQAWLEQLKQGAQSRCGHGLPQQQPTRALDAGLGIQSLTSKVPEWTDFALLVAAAFDDVMTPQGWARLLGPNGDPAQRAGLLEVSRTCEWSHFVAREVVSA